MAKRDKKKDKEGFKAVEKQTASSVPPRMWKKYKDEVAPALMKEFGYANVMQVPKVEKIVLNMGLGEAVTNPNLVKSAQTELTRISGQRAVITRAKKSISNFKLRQGMPIGSMVTLRRAHMWEFFDRMVSLALPRVRDFKGVSGKAFDGRGNYNLGLKEQIVFGEVDYENLDQVKGMNITIITSAKNDKEGKALLKGLGFPFRN